MIENLLPCPFCGGEAKIDENIFARDCYELTVTEYSVWCSVCLIGFEYCFTSKEEANEAWNRRAEDERYKNALKEIIQLACESVEREKALAKLEAEVMALEVKRGEWEQNSLFDEDANVYVCSECDKPWTLVDGTPQENGMKFCPNCGTQMPIE